MFMHNKRLQYTVRVGETNPALASLLLEQFGGADGELAAAMRRALARTIPAERTCSSTSPPRSSATLR
jgi:hypothetical protein